MVDCFPKRPIFKLFCAHKEDGRDWFGLLVGRKGGTTNLKVGVNALEGGVSTL